MPGPGATPILFVHGSPGDWKAWAEYLRAPALADFGPRIAVDRPGFGASGPGEVILDLRAQAALLAGLIPDGTAAIAVGHSLGGPLVAWLAIDHPEKVCGAVMVAGSVAPDLEAPRWYNHLADTLMGKWLVPDELLWSNREMMALRTELRQLDAAWSGLARPLVAVQGGRDRLVDPRTADYLERRAPPRFARVVRLPEQGHFLLWQQPERVVREIVGLGSCSAGSGARRG